MMLERILPFFAWKITRETLKHDLTAGITVALVVIPQSLAYAQLAGLPAHYGLYAAFIPSITGVLFGSLGQLSTGPVAMTSLLTIASITPLAAIGSELFNGYAILIALLSGLFQLGFGLMRIGILLNLLSHPVLMGFINAAAIIIALSQLPSLMGISTKQTQHFLRDSWEILTGIEQLHTSTLAFGLTAIFLLIIFKKFFPKLPGVLLTTMLLTWVSYDIEFVRFGGSVVGNIPQGLPSLAVPTMEWKTTTQLIPAAFIIAVVSFLEAMSSCKVIAIKTRRPWDENQELIGQGLAKILAAFSQSMPVSGSFSRSALNLAAGAKTGLSSIISAFCVLLTLLFFTGVLYHLPKAVLAAIIMTAVADLVNAKSIKQAWRASTDDGVAALSTFAATLLFAPNIQNGIVTGIIVALSLFLYRRMRPRIVRVGLHPDGTLRDAVRFNLPPLHEKIGALRVDAALNFVNAAYFEEAVSKLGRDNRKLKYILIAANGINSLDASGVVVLSNLVEKLRENRIVLVISGVKKQVMDVMEKTGLAKSIGEENIFSADRLALDALYRRLNQEST
jgi:sulfate permease, SulP family